LTAAVFIVVERGASQDKAHFSHFIASVGPEKSKSVEGREYYKKMSNPGGFADPTKMPGAGHAATSAAPSGLGFVAPAGGHVAGQHVGGGAGGFATNAQQQHGVRGKRE